MSWSASRLSRPGRVSRSARTCDRGASGRSLSLSAVDVTRSGSRGEVMTTLLDCLSILMRPSGTFLASELLSGKRAGQDLFSGWAGVLPKSSPRGVGVESEDVVEAFLGGVGVGEDALGAGTAFVAGGVEKEGFLD